MDEHLLFDIRKAHLHRADRTKRANSGVTFLKAGLLLRNLQIFRCYTLKKELYLN